jgi:thiosulfate reductase cytochrome b subunit
MAEKIYLYPLWVRLWHAANALLCLVLIISGISMQFSEPGRTLIRFDVAVTIHNSASLLLVINYVLFVIANRLSDNGKFYKFPRKNYMSNLVVQFKYYTYGIFRGAKAPFPINPGRKFNPLQHFTYIVVMYFLLPIIMITGCGMFFPELVISKIFGISGLFLTDLVHIVVGFAISMFLVVHLYFCLLGTSLLASFRSMISGWADVH